MSLDPPPTYPMLQAIARDGVAYICATYGTPPGLHYCVLAYTPSGPSSVAADPNADLKQLAHVLRCAGIATLEILHRNESSS